MKLRDVQVLGFSLVEVAVAGAVLGTAAVMLSAAMSTSNSQKHLARRQALARSLVLRQLEHFQAKIDESFRPGSVVDVAAAGLRMAPLRAAGVRVGIDRVGTSNVQFEVQPMQDLERRAAGTRILLPSTNEFHVYGGGMTTAELNRINNERIGLNVYVSTASIQSIDQNGALLPPLSSGGYDPLERANMFDLDLLMVQVSSFDSIEPTQRFFALSRIYRVPTRALFPPIPGSGERGKF